VTRIAHRCLCGLRGRAGEELFDGGGLRLLVIRAILIRPLKAFDQDLLSSRTNLGLRGRNLIDGSSGIRISFQYIEQCGSGIAGHVLGNREHESVIAEFGAALGGVECFGRRFGRAGKE